MLATFLSRALVLCAAIFVFVACGSDQVSNQANYDDRVEEILSEMTLEDKVGEMTQLSIDVLSVGEPYNLEVPNRLDPDKMQRVLVDLRVGSILNVGGYAYTREEWKEIITRIQDIAVNEKPTGIPVLYGIDAIHGTNYTRGATLCPHQLGLASTWNPALVEAAASVTAYETRASGIPWTFSPVMDIGRDQRWPRLYETFGEDVHLASELGKAMVRGFQGEDVSAPDKIAACLKHFLGYSVTLRGHDRTQAWVPERQLREYFVPPFQAAIDEGAKTIMICSGDMNGIPVHANKAILTDLLRDEMGFKGVALTDWHDIGYLVERHRVAANTKEAITMAINAGVDMAMVPMDTEFPAQLKELVEEGIVPMSRIDESVRRILQLKVDLGLFEQPVPDFDSYERFGDIRHHAVAMNAAQKSYILAKNEDDILPLSGDERIFVTGPTANSLNVLNGGWTGTWQGNDPRYNNEDRQTILEGLREQFGNKVSYAPGTSFNAAIDIYEAVRQARNADVIIACLGEMTYTEMPGNLNDMRLSKAQRDLVKALSETGKPIVLVMIQGRPRVINDIEPLAKGVILGFLPGDFGAAGLANILAGEANPSGHLPITYPKEPNDLFTYDHKWTDRVDTTLEHKFGALSQWPFGHGLSYTTFEYSNLTLEKSVLGDNDTLNFTFDLRNTGLVPGGDVVQVYVSDHVASIAPPVERLRGFEYVSMSPRSRRPMSMYITSEDLAFVGKENKWIREPGKFTLRVGDLEAEFEYQPE